MSERKIALGATLAVCLGSGVKADGTASETTLLRATAASQLALAHPEMTIILSGDGRKDEDPQRRSAFKTEAEVMAEILSKAGISSHRLLVEDESRDTIGNAVLTAVRYLSGETPRPLHLITSPFHTKRALASFQGVLGDKWQITIHTCPPASDDESRGAKEAGGIDWTTKFFQTITKGDITACAKRLLEVGKPAYKTVARLQLAD